MPTKSTLIDIMSDKFLPEISAEQLKVVQEKGDMHAYYDLLCQPLHEELYRRQDFVFLEDLTEAQQLFISYDYVQNQVLQGGFIQLFQNGYVGLLPNMPAWLMTVGQEHMAQVIDDALKEFVLNHETLSKETTVEEFALLYDQLPQFGNLDDRFKEHHEETLKGMLEFATHHIEEFAVIK